MEAGGGGANERVHTGRGNINLLMPLQLNYNFEHSFPGWCPCCKTLTEWGLTAFQGFYKDKMSSLNCSRDENTAHVQTTSTKYRNMHESMNYLQLLFLCLTNNSAWWTILLLENTLTLREELKWTKKKSSYTAVRKQFIISMWLKLPSGGNGASQWWQRVGMSR